MTKLNTDVYEAVLDPRLTEVDRKLRRSVVEVSITSVLFVAAIVVASIVIRDLWPPRDNLGVTAE